MLQEIAEKFIAWTKIKIKIHQKGQEDIGKCFFREKEIWWAHLGKNVGFEEDRKNENFDRPVIILRKFNGQLFWGIPTSMKIKPDNQFYRKFEINGEFYSAILSQMRPMSIKRLIRKIGAVSIQDFNEIKKKTSELIKNDSHANE